MKSQDTGTMIYTADDLSAAVREERARTLQEVIDGATVMSQGREVYSQAQLDAAVREAVKPYHEQHEWLAANLAEIVCHGAALIFRHRRYATLDALVSSEMLREKPNV